MSQTVKSVSGPIITGPTTANAKIGQAVALPCKVTDPTWPTTKNVTLQVAVGVGTLAMVLNGKPVMGSGSASIVLTDSVANVQAALASLSFTP